MANTVFFAKRSYSTKLYFLSSADHSFVYPSFPNDPHHIPHPEKHDPGCGIGVRDVMGCGM